jgi:hypothetical protein
MSPSTLTFGRALGRVLFDALIVGAATLAMGVRGIAWIAVLLGPAFAIASLGLILRLGRVVLGRLPLGIIAPTLVGPLVLATLAGWVGGTVWYAGLVEASFTVGAATAVALGLVWLRHALASAVHRFAAVSAASAHQRVGRWAVVAVPLVVAVALGVGASAGWMLPGVALGSWLWVFLDRDTPDRFVSAGESLIVLLAVADTSQAPRAQVLPDVNLDDVPASFPVLEAYRVLVNVAVTLGVLSLGSMLWPFWVFAVVCVGPLVAWFSRQRIRDLHPAVSGVDALLVIAMGGVWPLPAALLDDFAAVPVVFAGAAATLVGASMVQGAIRAGVRYTFRWVDDGWSVETTLFGARLSAARAPAGHPWAVEVRGQALRVVRLGALAVRADGLDASSLAVAMRPPGAKPLPSLVGNTQTPRAAFSGARALPLDARVAGGIVPALTLTGLGGLLAAWSAGFVGPTLAPWVPAFVWGGVGGWVAWGVTRAWRRA